MPAVTDTTIADDLHRVGHVGELLLQQVHEVGAACGNDEQDPATGHSKRSGDLARVLKA